MSKERLNVGRRGEELAARHLEAQGYGILERNYRCALGEMDIVAQDGEVLVFVEVRTRRNLRFGRPEESVTPAKQRKLVEVALSYLSEKCLDDVDWRIDVVAIEMGYDGRVRRLNLIPNAVGWDAL